MLNLECCIGNIDKTVGYTSLKVSTEIQTKDSIFSLKYMVSLAGRQNEIIRKLHINIEEI